MPSGYFTSYTRTRDSFPFPGIVIPSHLRDYCFENSWVRGRNSLERDSQLHTSIRGIFGAKSNDHSNHVCLRLLKVYTFLLINSKGSFIITAAICYFVSNILAYQSENYTLVLIKVLLAKRVSLQTVQLLLAHLHVAPFTFTFNSILVHLRRFPLIFAASL